MFDGVPVETEEMIPTWFERKNIPFDKMLQDDRLWWPYLLDDKKFVGDVKFDENLVMQYHKFEEIVNFEKELNL